MNQTTIQSEVESNLKAAVGMSGLLFQPHPQVGDWKTTRALSPEITAWSNKEAQFFRLAIEYHEAEIPDENGYIPQEDEYRVVAIDPKGDYGEMPAEAVYNTIEAAIKYVAELMIYVTEERE